MNTRKSLLCVFLLLLAILVACSPAAAPSMEPTAASGPSQVISTTTAPAIPTQAPASGINAPTQSSALEVPSAAPQKETTQLVSPTPVVSAVIEEQRVVEVEWPGRLNLGDSDAVRLSLVPNNDGYTVQAEFPEHQLQSEPVRVVRPEGYRLAAVARLDGVGFDIAPAGDQRRLLPVEETVTWHWSLAAKKPGQHRLTVMLLLRWEGEAGTGLTDRESLIYSRALNVQVLSFLGMNRTQATRTGLAGLLAGGLLSAVAFIFRAKKPGLSLPNVRPNDEVQLDALPGLLLGNGEVALLQALFRRYARVSVEREFLSGYSGARTLVAIPERPDGSSDAETIVKIGMRPAILKEYANYEQYVKDHLPPVTARIQHEPVTIAGMDRAALQYTFLSEPGRQPVSLEAALLAHPDPALLSRLFDTFGPQWWLQHRPFSFRLVQEYDSFLPPHLILSPIETHAVLQKRVEESLVPSDIHTAPWEEVWLKPFRQAEKRSDGESYTLYGIEKPGQPRLRVRWLSETLPDRPVPARVVNTRLSLLQKMTQSMARYSLPDPLACMNDLLNERVSGSQSIIHGDLNLQNILVGPGELVWLIDFAQTRIGHTLLDFAHLEADLIAHILSVQIKEPTDYVKILHSGDHPLLSALHEMAGNCLFRPDQPREYWLALYAACLGALKYRNLNVRSQHFLYLTAADLTRRL